VDGVSIQARNGECLAIALAIAGVRVLRHSPAAGAPRGMFCLMGSCQECVVHVDEAPTLACIETVRPGMRVTLDRLSRERLAPERRD
jgi:aerobic-type carbon monoxide dehydrogenase small subunit (CoxS/CutS family)